MKKTRLLLLLALLMTAATGARAAWTGGTYTATATENLGAITVNGDATLTINSDVTVTVTGGINVASGTLTVTGPGTLVVTGAKGNNGASGWEGSNGGNGGVAISGNIIVQGGATVTATGGTGGNGGTGTFVAGTGGNGGVAFAGKLTYKSGTVTANGGSAGSGGYIDDEERYASSGSAGKAFANDVDFTQTTGYSVTNGTSTIGSVLNQTKVVISGGTEPSAPAGYTVSLKDGVKDADKWTVKVGEGQAQALPIGGLTGDGSETVTLQYTGRLKVKGVKATSEAAEASVPDGALSGKFSVSDGKQVYFSKGNLRYASSKWSFFDNQYDYYTSYSEEENAWDKFGWSTSAPTYGMNTTTSVNDYQGDFVDWGATMGAGWFTLSSDEWTYLLNNRSASTVGGTENGRYAKAKVNDVKGVILFPDTYTHPDGVTAPTGVNATAAAGWNANSYTAADWTKMESAGCVFLPAAGRRNGSSMEYAGERGVYWSATPNGTYYAYGVLSTSDILNPAYPNSRRLGSSVRLVREAAATDAEQAKEPATVTTAPTGAAVVGVGKNTALVSGGVADGGTLWYAVTTTNTKPASTDGFSATVPTAETITASGKVYVWYYVKGDDTHSDSEIAGPVSVTVTPALSLTNPVVGQVIGSDGKNYAAASVPSGVTKVAMIAYVSGSNGLAIALADEGEKNWATAKSTCEAKTPAFTNGTWHLPSQAEWNNMFSANGGDEESYTGLNTAINNAGGTTLQSGFYWSSSEYSPGVGAHLVHLDDGDADWSKLNETLVRKVRACLAF